MGVESAPDANHLESCLRLARARTTSRRVADEVERGGAELVLHIGDISYANGDPDIWDTFMDYIEPYAARAPYMLGIGNHEYDWRTGTEKRRKHRRATDASGRDAPYDPDWGNYGASQAPGRCNQAGCRTSRCTAFRHMNLAAGHLWTCRTRARRCAKRGSQRGARRAGNDSGGECGVAVAARFLMPGAAGLGSAPPAEPYSNCSAAAAVCGRRRRARALANPPFWYAFEYGSVHFSIISSEHDLTRGSEQREARAARAQWDAYSRDLFA